MTWKWSCNHAWPKIDNVWWLPKFCGNKIQISWLNIKWRWPCQNKTNLCVFYFSNYIFFRTFYFRISLKTWHFGLSMFYNVSCDQGFKKKRCEFLLVMISRLLRTTTINHDSCFLTTFDLVCKTTLMFGT